MSTDVQRQVYCIIFVLIVNMVIICNKLFLKNRVMLCFYAAQKIYLVISIILYEVYLGINELHTSLSFLISFRTHLYIFA